MMEYLDGGLRRYGTCIVQRHGSWTMQGFKKYTFQLLTVQMEVCDLLSVKCDISCRFVLECQLRFPMQRWFHIQNLDEQHKFRSTVLLNISECQIEMEITQRLEFPISVQFPISILFISICLCKWETKDFWAMITANIQFL